MIVHVVDGTYELFRHFYGLRRFTKGRDRPFGGVVGVLQTVLQMIEQGATHVGVATDHVIESFRNRMWPGYKTGEGIEPALLRFDLDHLGAVAGEQAPGVRAGVPCRKRENANAFENLAGRHQIKN